MTELSLPKVIFGTSALGNLFSEPDFSVKKEVVSEIIRCSAGTPVFDSAGKYGAGLALECLGQALEELGVQPSDVQISNKLGWKRIPLVGSEPTFEPGAWVNLKNDAEQAISYDGIHACFEQGNELLGRYASRIASIHDPDEYLDGASDEQERNTRTQHVLDAYRALADLKTKGDIDSIGVGSKDPKVIDLISQQVQLDWAMFACSITPYTHEEHVLSLVKRLGQQGVKIINSAVFNSGFLIGSANFDYVEVSRETRPELFAWRDKFMAICNKYNASPASVCVQFSFRFPEIVSVALNTSSPKRVEGNMTLATTPIDPQLWDDLKKEGLIHID